MWSNVAYFSTWRPHENRVSKTRFPTLINIEEPSTHIRENLEKKKKSRRTQKPRQRATWVVCCLGFFHPGARCPGCAQLGPVQRNPGSAQPGSRATWAARRETQAARSLGRALPRFFSPRCTPPRSRATWAVCRETQAARGLGCALPGFFSPRYLRLMVGRFFLPSDLIVVIVDF